MGPEFEKYVKYVVPMLQSATQLSVNTPKTDEEMIELGLWEKPPEPPAPPPAPPAAAVNAEGLAGMDQAQLANLLQLLAQAQQPAQK